MSRMPTLDVTSSSGFFASYRSASSPELTQDYARTSAPLSWEIVPVLVEPAEGEPVTVEVPPEDVSA